MKSFVLSIVFLIALYFGTGGFLILENDLKVNEVRNTKTTSENAQSLKMDLDNLLAEQTLIVEIYPYILKLPTVLSFLITAMCFGMMGAIAKVINDIIQARNKVEDTINLLLIPLLGAFIGLIILGVSYALPTLLTNENISLKPISIVFLSLFGGIYYMKFFKKFLTAIDRIGTK